jgi:hypothetical protein
MFGLLLPDPWQPVRTNVQGQEALLPGINFMGLSPSGVGVPQLLFQVDPDTVAGAAFLECLQARRAGGGAPRSTEEDSRRLSCDAHDEYASE